MTSPHAAVAERIVKQWDNTPCLHCDAGRCKECQIESIATALTEARREVWLEAASEVQATRLSLDNPPRPVAAINADLNELAYKFRRRSHTL